MGIRDRRNRGVNLIAQRSERGGRSPPCGSRDGHERGALGAVERRGFFRRDTNEARVPFSGLNGCRGATKKFTIFDLPRASNTLHLVGPLTQLR